MRLLGRRAWLALMLLNLLLQCYDGVTTYLGLQAGLIAEGNPFLCRACAELGPAVTLLISKLVAIYLVVLIWQMRESWLAAPALGFLSAYYGVIALAPWAMTLAQ